jgi:hypothetical protein
MLHFERNVREHQRAMRRFDRACLHDFQQFDLSQQQDAGPPWLICNSPAVGLGPHAHGFVHSVLLTHSVGLLETTGRLVEALDRTTHRTLRLKIQLCRASQVLTPSFQQQQQLQFPFASNTTGLQSEKATETFHSVLVALHRVLQTCHACCIAHAVKQLKFPIVGLNDHGIPLPKYYTSAVANVARSTFTFLQSSCFQHQPLRNAIPRHALRHMEDSKLAVDGSLRNLSERYAQQDPRRSSCSALWC